MYLSRAAWVFYLLSMSIATAILALSAYVLDTPLFLPLFAALFSLALFGASVYFLVWYEEPEDLTPPPPPVIPPHHTTWF